MFETPLTVTGRIVTDPVRRRVADQELVKFRLASNARRRTGDGSWEPGNSLYLTVNCWGKLAAGVSGSLAKGDAVIVVGHVYTSEYEDREGIKRSSAELRATAVGPDLSRYLARIEKINQNVQPGPDALPEDAALPEEAAEAEPAEEGAADTADGLPLSA
ncbi:single-stranded DNA-binding protein [Mycolicibacterium mengxianglii]|uniref:single-stranded DNA-binding protein n=1 Tax=Mycolicibacterium mengxianglii TaxID=2736649 RepID=UPI0018D0410E|nr:single-stranded DNA-binding protein [Mycolicibacterium mengxianglii]